MSPIKQRIVRMLEWVAARTSANLRFFRAEKLASIERQRRHQRPLSEPTRNFWSDAFNGRDGR